MPNPTSLLARLLLALGIGLAATASSVAQDASDFVVRLNRVENVTRQLSGQIEQLQYENRQLKEQLRKFQEDVEYRFQEGKGGGSGAGTGGARPPAAARPTAPPAVQDGTTYGTNPGAGRPGKRGDAFDPAQNPGAPGAPRPLGAATASAPAAVAPQGEMRVVGRVAQAGDQGNSFASELEEDESDASASGFGEPVDLAPPRAADQEPYAPRPQASIAATGSGDARADFDEAYALVKGRQYEQAEMSLRQFIQSHPRDKLVPRATYWLGETYLQRNRSREAAEQFLKVSTDYAGSPIAPEAMLKLGASLSALGAKSQACATLAEVERKFPSATSSIRQSVEREQKRARCSA